MSFGFSPASYMLLNGTKDLRICLWLTHMRHVFATGIKFPHQNLQSFFSYIEIEEKVSSLGKKLWSPALTFGIERGKKKEY